MRTAHGIQLRWLYRPMWASARSPRVGNGLDRSARTAPPASLGARDGDFPGIAPREAGKQVTGINIIKEESPWIRIWLPGRKPGRAGGGSAKGPSHLLPGKAGCHCPGGQSGLSVQCRRAGPHGLGGNGVWHPPGQRNQKSLCGPAGLGGHPGPADRGHSPGGPGAKGLGCGSPRRGHCRHCSLHQSHLHRVL